MFCLISLSQITFRKFWLWTVGDARFQWTGNSSMPSLLSSRKMLAKRAGKGIETKDLTQLSIHLLHSHASVYTTIGKGRKKELIEHSVDYGRPHLLSI